MMRHVTVTVLIPAFNAAATIERALSSVINQKILPAEIIVIDDGSTDVTADICRSYQARTDVPLIVHSMPNGGVSRARNGGIAMAKSTHIAFLDADDEWLPCHIEHFNLAMTDTPSALLYYCGMERRFDKGLIESRESLPDFNAMSMSHCRTYIGQHIYLVDDSITTDLIKGNFIPTSAAIVRSDYAGCNLFPEDVHFAEDRIFFLNVVSNGLVIFSDRIGCLIHRHAYNASLTTDAVRNYANNLNAIRVFEKILLIQSINSNPEYRSTAANRLHGAKRVGIFYASVIGVAETRNAIKRFWLSCDTLAMSDFTYIFKQLAKAVLRWIVTKVK